MPECSEQMLALAAWFSCAMKSLLMSHVHGAKHRKHPGLTPLGSRATHKLK